MSIEGDMMRDSPQWQREQDQLQKDIANRDRLRALMWEKYPEVVEWLVAEWHGTGDAKWRNLAAALRRAVGGIAPEHPWPR